MHRALAAVKVAVLIDEDGLARCDVADQLEAERIERHAFGSDDVFDAQIGERLPDHQRPNAEGIAKGQQPVAGDAGDYRIGPAATPMHAGYGRENRIGIELVCMRAVLQLMRKHVEQDFRI